MKKLYSVSNFFRTRILFLSVVLLGSLKMVGGVTLPEPQPGQDYKDGWTPTSCGLVLNFEKGDQFMLSVMIDTDEDGDPEEYFVCDYPSYKDGPFNYEATNTLKLIAAPSATVAPAGAVWTVGTLFPRDYPLDGIAYTMWSDGDRDKAQTIVTTGNDYTYTGRLATSDGKYDPKQAKTPNYLCDVAFAVPTIRSLCADPDSTLGRGGPKPDGNSKFDGQTGVGFNGMVYREVYWFFKSRVNGPQTYTTMQMISFFKKDGANIVCDGNPWQVGGKKNARYKPRTLFRIYPINKPFSICPNQYFFGWDVQNYLKYRNVNVPSKPSDYTSERKIYTSDHWEGMKRVGSTKYYQTDYITVPPSDSTYFYVGYDNKYRNSTSAFDLGSGGALSQFTSILSLRVKALADVPAPPDPKADTLFTPKAGAYGKMVIDTTTSANNLGVSFEPAGYFLRTNSALNIEMHPGTDEQGAYWQTEEAWTITEEIAKSFRLKATLYTGAEFSTTDPGADIRGWSTMFSAADIPLKQPINDIDTIPYGTTGWARLYPGNPALNGGMVFVQADNNKYIVYDNNGHFGEDIPDQHTGVGENTLTIQAPRLLGDYEFTGWNTAADGSGTSYAVGATVDLSSISEVDGKHVLHLYAQANYTGNIHIAISFVKADGKRYFMTHPNTAAPRFAHARHFEDWTSTSQGMLDPENSDPNFLSTYKIIGKNTICKRCGEDEYIFDPTYEVMHGSVDSLAFYEYFRPDTNEYIGLYYNTPNTIVANKTWAGLFRSSNGWPTPAHPCIESTTLSSTHYLGGFNGKDTSTVRRIIRSAPDSAYIRYTPAGDKFDGGAAEFATSFMLSGVGVVDNYYVILPGEETEETEWVDEIVFDYHSNQNIEKQIWSTLVGKQLLAQMKVGDDTIYFHPNTSKTLSTAGELSRSVDYRIVQSFTYIPDARGGSLDSLSAAFKTSMSETGNDFSQIITSGIASPMEIKDGKGNYIDICDTIRVRLTPSASSKIKEYYGRWKTGAAGLHIAKDGSRYRDIIIRTKTYHYGEKDSALVLTPDQEQCILSPLAGQKQKVTFKLQKQVFHWLHELRGEEHIRVEKEILSTTDVTSGNLSLAPASCSFVSGTYFDVSAASYDSVVIATKSENAISERLDTLIVSVPEKNIEGHNYPAFTTRVPLRQAKLVGDELVWSVMKDDVRYFITAGSGGLIFRKYKLDKSTLYKFGSDKTQLEVGSANAANDDDRYITPWKYIYTNQAQQQLRLKTEYGVFRGLAFSSETPGAAAVLSDTTAAASSSLTYEYVRMNTNDNANFEEVVYLKYGSSHWLKFTGTALELTATKAEASIFYWGYLLPEYHLQNNGTYPNPASLEFNYARTAKTVTTACKAYRNFSMLLDNSLVYCCRIDRTSKSDLTNPEYQWKLSDTITLKHDGRTFNKVVSSGLTASTPANSFVTTVTPDATVPTDVMIDGKYVDIVDTLIYVLGLQDGAPTYQFDDKWSSFKSIRDTKVKIPLICKTYHDAPLDSLICHVADDQYNYTFPSKITKDVDDSIIFTISTVRRVGTQRMDIDDNLVTQNVESNTNILSGWDLSNVELAELRLIDGSGATPSWCHISKITQNTITVKCTADGIRSPRTAYIYMAYIVTIDEQMRFVNYRLSVSQPSFFQYKNNQTLIHQRGASGDPLMDDGRQQAHENKRVLYYYNPEPYDEPDQNVELPVRERGFYGWWRWYEEGEDTYEADIPNAKWQTPPRNVSHDGKKNFPYRIIGDSVFTVVDGDTTERKLVTMGRYTVFHYPSKDYGDKNDPPAKSPLVFPPDNEKVVTYSVDISNYYDNLPLSIKNKNQVDTARLDTMQNIYEPTLSLREVFELRPWTEMAETMERYKSHIPDNANPNNGYSLASEHYMEDHVMMAPTGNRLLLRTEQRYNYDNLKAGGHSESQLGYYMRDDNWNKTDGDWTFANDAARKACQDTMIWCGGWDVDCEWYTYNATTRVYTKSDYKVNQSEDFLEVPARAGITAGYDFDTIYYCLRARSKKTTNPADDKTTTVGDYWFNICRYMVIYHNPTQYGPMQETIVGGVKKAIMTNDEINQTYEVLERLNFDYNKPGSDYTIYPHPLPWGDGSYGYTYPVGPELPVNRYHAETDFPGPGEYSIINKIPYSSWWRKLEQHGGAANGYMIYCDGMSSAGQVAALSLNTILCEGQKMYFSGYVGNVSNQKGKSNPNFTFSVQGSVNGTVWTDITSYTTGDIQPSDNWYQIFFPISFNVTDGSASNLTHFRVRIYNMASSFDGNDFVLDDMCLFATKPPLIAYQANTACVEKGESDSITHVVIRVDYQGFTDEAYKGKEIFYSVDRVKNNDTTFIQLIDGFINQDDTHKAILPATVDTIFGRVKMPSPTYVPVSSDSIFTNFQELSAKFEETLEGHTRHPRDTAIFQQGYIFENIDNTTRPVMYIIHKAKMTPDCQYMVRMSLAYKDLHSSICAMTSSLKVSNRMVLELNGEERESMENADLCANTTYDISLRVKGMQFADGAAPLAVNGTCMSDWLPGDTTDAGCLARYGYHYDVIVDVVKNILRAESTAGMTNANQFAANLAAVDHDNMLYIQKSKGVEINGKTEPTKDSADDPYVILTNLTERGLIMYQPTQTAHVISGDSVEFVILPIIGSGSEEVRDANVEICPEPLYIKLKPSESSQDVPLVIGGTMRNEDASKPVVIVSDLPTIQASGVTVHINEISAMRKWHSIELISTDDPNYRVGVHTLNMVADKEEYTSGQNMVITLAPGNNYTMQPGYSYTFGIVMQTRAGALEFDGCPVGTIPFVLSVVPDYLRWDPQTLSADKWNDPNNWIGITQQNEAIHANARFAPQRHTSVVIPTLTDGRKYPVLADMSVHTGDSIRQVGFQYNQCADIRFMPDVVVGEQYRLTYDNAIVDMTTPQEKWALRAAPVKGMLSGDIFMANADLNWETSPWEVGAFDASGRNNKTGNASFWLSFYNRTIVQQGNNDQVKDSTRNAAAEWSRVANGMTESLPAGQGWAIYTRTKSGRDATVRLPKHDNVYYYYTAAGDTADVELAHHNLQTIRNTYAGGSGAGKLAFNASSFEYTLSNGVESNLFVFGNPTMAYIDIWGFIADNSTSPALMAEFDYLNTSGMASSYTTVVKKTADASEDVITNPLRYLPPMHAIVVKLSGGATATSKAITLNASRVVTATDQVVRPLPTPAPSRNAYGRSKGIMTVTAVNPADAICTSRLLIGQGYHNGIIEGEDAVLTTINIANFSSTTPNTPFNIYAAEGNYGLSIDLRDEVVNVPIAFYNTPLPYEPITYLWFTGVNNIEGSLVLYDALTDTERPIFDGICLDIETPQTSHEARYYIRRPGYLPDEPTTPTGVVQFSTNDEPVVKIIRDGHVLILRNGHVYTMFGQKIR